jgi:hypothetical protein
MDGWFGSRGKGAERPSKRDVFQVKVNDRLLGEIARVGREGMAQHPRLARSCCAVSNQASAVAVSIALPRCALT